MKFKLAIIAFSIIIVLAIVWFWWRRNKNQTAPITTSAFVAEEEPSEVNVTGGTFIPAPNNNSGGSGSGTGSSASGSGLSSGSGSGSSSGSGSGSGSGSSSGSGSGAVLIVRKSSTTLYGAMPNNGTIPPVFQHGNGAIISVIQVNAEESINDSYSTGGDGTNEIYAEFNTPSMWVGQQLAIRITYADGYTLTSNSIDF